MNFYDSRLFRGFLAMFADPFWLSLLPQMISMLAEKFRLKMEAKDESPGLDFGALYDEIAEGKNLLTPYPMAGSNRRF